MEHRVRDFRRARLQPKDDSVQEDIGYGNNQKQEQHGKKARAKGQDAVAKNESADPDDHHGKNQDGQLVILAQGGGVSLAERVEQSATAKQAQSRPPTCLNMRENLFSSKKEKRGAMRTM